MSEVLILATSVRQGIVGSQKSTVQSVRNLRDPDMSGVSLITVAKERVHVSKEAVLLYKV
jgi:hypothetical protein